MDTKTVFEGAIFTLEQTQVEIKGRLYPRDFIRHHGGVGIVVIKDRQILLVRQMRHCVDEDLLEIPAGKLEKDEDPEAAAMRELNEETGLECDRLESICSFYSTPGFCDEKIHLFVAINPRTAPQRRAMDEDEDISLQWMDLDEASEGVFSGRIRDAKTMIAIFYAQKEKEMRE